MRKRARKSKTNERPTCKFEAANSSLECKKIKRKLEYEPLNSHPHIRIAYAAALSVKALAALNAEY